MSLASFQMRERNDVAAENQGQFRQTCEYPPITNFNTIEAEHQLGEAVGPMGAKG